MSYFKTRIAMSLTLINDRLSPPFHADFPILCWWWCDVCALCCRFRCTSPQVWYVVTKTKLEKLNPCNLEKKETWNFYSTLTVWNIPTSAGRKGTHQEEGAFERNFICRRKKKCLKKQWTRKVKALFLRNILPREKTKRRVAWESSEKLVINL